MLFYLQHIKAKWSLGWTSFQSKKIKKKIKKKCWHQPVLCASNKGHPAKGIFPGRKDTTILAWAHWPPIQSGLEHMVSKKKLRWVCPGWKKKGKGQTLLLFATTSSQGKEKMEPDSSQRCTAIEWGPTATSWNMRSSSDSRGVFLTKNGQTPGQVSGAVVGSPSLEVTRVHLDTCLSNPIQLDLFWAGGGTRCFQRSLLTWIILWFSDSIITRTKPRMILQTWTTGRSNRNNL